jgi:uroporphyrinogen-III decarboxylase
MREWMGFEGLCLAFKDDPTMVRDMVVFWTDYTSHLLEKLLSTAGIDYLHISEDMAYKAKPMIGPQMSREFLAPCWRQWGEILRSHDVPIYDIDSDGYVADLIPVWIECGMNVCDPVEVAAGNDINAMRRAFGRAMAFQGGVDKRAMAAGGAELEAEMDRVASVVGSGGYIPGCDHGIPPDVSWPNMVTFCDRLARMTGWK